MVVPVQDSVKDYADLYVAYIREAISLVEADISAFQSVQCGSPDAAAQLASAEAFKNSTQARKDEIQKDLQTLLGLMEVARLPDSVKYVNQKVAEGRSLLKDLGNLIKQRAAIQAEKQECVNNPPVIDPPGVEEPAPVTPEQDPALQEDPNDPLAPLIDEPTPVSNEELNPGGDPAAGADPLAPLIDEPTPVSNEELNPGGDFLGDGELTDEDLDDFLNEDDSGLEPPVVEEPEIDIPDFPPDAPPTAGQGAAAAGDWRIKLSLAGSANYFYKAGGDIMAPLAATNGIVFPYVPTITVNYQANYGEENPTHSNYKILFYSNSYIGDVTITGDFTAQDSAEAAYMLAVIHFGRSATKMFYGQDGDPANGVPPPLVFLTGVGDFHFSNHPLVITGFTMNYPNNVDYIRCIPGQEISTASRLNVATIEQRAASRLGSIGVGGIRPPPEFTTLNQPNYVPTKTQLTFTCKPVVSRNVISREFSLRDYANGSIYSRPGRGGIW